jgi:nitronate monooxygenase
MSNHRLNNDFMRRFGMVHPIIQAPLAAGGDTPELVAAVSNAGGMGFIGAAYLAPNEIRNSAAQVRARTSRPFGINLFAPQAPSDAPGNPEVMLARVAPYFEELNLPAPSLPAAPAKSSFEDQLAAALESQASCFNFTFGTLPDSAIRAIRSRNIFLMGTATTVQEAVILETSGVDAVVAQDSEAGGHRGTFATDFTSGMVGTISLVPQVADAMRLPVIASGGIMDGRV